MDWPLLLRAARLRAGLTQQQVADRAGTSRSRMSSYESGAVAPSASTLERLLAATHCHLTIETGLAVTSSEQRSINLHRAIVEHLLVDPEKILAKARHNITVMREADHLGHARLWLDRWQELINGDLADLVAVMLSISEEARALRQSTPFAAVLTPTERKAIIATRSARAS